MGKFFVPSAWGQESKPLQFKTIHGNLSGGTTSGSDKKAKAHKKKANKKPAPNDGNKATKGAGPLAPPAEVTASSGAAKVQRGRVQKATTATKATKKQRRQQKLQLTPALAKAAQESVAAKKEAHRKTTNGQEATAAPAGGVASLQAKLKSELMGGRFRYLNEQLYTMNGHSALQLFNADKAAFDAYHAGYRHQVDKWPLNPLDRIIKMVRRLPHSLEIGDFGCGEAKLAKAVPHKVHSLDLVSNRPDVVACDMANTPLKPESLDVAVYCLSLMGTNLNDFLLEANRVLRMNGIVYIAEIQSRFDDVRQFVRSVEACGFELVKKDVSVNVFYFFQFRKVRNVGKVALLAPFSLKPCLYRKR